MQTLVRSFPILGALAGVALAGEGTGTPTPQDPQEPQDPKITFEKLTLPNGMEVILHQDRRTPIVAVDVWYHVGSGDETPQKSGFAHLFEHMMFQGSQHTGEDVHFKILQEIGSSDMNGTTTSDRTNYYEQVPSNQLEVALWLESDRMGYLLPGVNEKSLANQREVVRNERRQRYDNVPYGKSRFALAEALYDEGHPYRYMTIGRHEDLERAQVEDVKGFFRKWYTPANATLCIAGDFDVAGAKKLVEKWFGSFPASTRPSRNRVAPTPVVATERVVVDDAFAKLRRVHYAWHTPAVFEPGDAELDILASALGDQGTGRLYRRLVLETQLAKGVMVYQQSQQMSSTFNIMVDVKDPADLTAVEKIIDQELERAISEPISERELRRTVIAMESMAVWGLESIMARCEELQHSNHLTGNPDTITQNLDRYRKATVQGVKTTTAKFLQKQNRVEVITMPAASAKVDVKKGANQP